MKKIKEKDLLTIKEFKEIYSKVSRATVSLVIKTNKGIALSLRNLPSWRNKWHLPGGTIFYKETVENAVKRKAKEELGIKVKIVKLLGYIEYPSEEKERGRTVPERPCKSRERSRGGRRQMAGGQRHRRRRPRRHDGRGAGIAGTYAVGAALHSIHLPAKLRRQNAEDCGERYRGV